MTDKTRFLLILLCCLICTPAVWSHDSRKNCNEPYHSEEFSFLAKGDSTLLRATLTLPHHFHQKGKLVILVAPPQPRSRDYLGMFSSMADTLTKSGVGVFRFDNRAFSNKNLADEETTMMNQVDDVILAIRAIKADPRFRKTRIGLAGHSEGASAAAIVAAKHRMAFSIYLSTSGIKGIYLVYSNDRRNYPEISWLA